MLETVERNKDIIDIEEESNFTVINPLNTNNLKDITPTELTTLKNEYLFLEDLPEADFKVITSNNKIGTETLPDHSKSPITQLVSVDNSVKNRIITYDFEKIFNREIEDRFKVFFNYDMSIRTYQAQTDQTVLDINYILNEYPQIAFNILNIRMKLNNLQESYDDVEFSKDISEIIKDKGLRSVIKTIVEDTYTLSLNDKNSEKTNIKKDLQVTDNINKAFLTSALMQRFILPITYQYLLDSNKLFTNNSVEVKERTNNLFYNLFNFIFSMFNKEYRVNGSNKLYKIIEPRVVRTNYNDRIIWGVLSNRGRDNQVIIDEMTQKIIRQIMVKLKPNSSSISFFDVVINNSLSHVFKKKFNFTFKPIHLASNSEDDEIDELDRLAMKHHHRENEMIRMIHKITMLNYIEDKIKEHNISDKELEVHHKRFRQINDFQKTIMNIFYSRHFDIVEYNRKDVVRLLVILSKELESKNIHTISKLVLAKVKFGERGRNSGKTSYDILSDQKYGKVMDMFESVSDLLARDNFVLKLASVYSYSFTIMDEDLAEEVDMEEIDKKSLAAEVADFISIY